MAGVPLLGLSCPWLLPGFLSLLRGCHEVTSFFFTIPFTIVLMFQLHLSNADSSDGLKSLKPLVIINLSSYKLFFLGILP
jgi:hypothetical protein